MSFDIAVCRKKFEDLSGTIQWGETINSGSDEIFRLFVRDLKGGKAEFDKILKDYMISPGNYASLACDPPGQSGGFELYSRRRENL